MATITVSGTAVIDTTMDVDVDAELLDVLDQIDNDDLCEHLKEQGYIAGDSTRSVFDQIDDDDEVCDYAREHLGMRGPE